MNVVETKQISKKYQTVYALHQVTINIPKGSIYGLIGRNGAGKSTLMKMICGQIHESEGSLCLFGNDPNKDVYAYRRIGSLIEHAGFYPSLNAFANMKIKALAMGCLDDGQIVELLQLCGLAQTGKKHVKHFSLGMKQRLGIAMALLGHPELLILDEPTNGLDPQGIRDIRSLLLKLNQEKGMTIVISSHILEELSKIASYYAIIKDGQILEELSREELQERCRDFICLSTANPAKTIALLEEEFSLTNYEVVENDLIHIYDGLDIADMINLLVRHQIAVKEVYQHKQDLEDYFLKKSGERHD